MKENPKQEDEFSKIEKIIAKDFPDFPDRMKKIRGKLKKSEEEILKIEKQNDRTNLP